MATLAPAYMGGSAHVMPMATLTLPTATFFEVPGLGVASNDPGTVMGACLTGLAGGGGGLICCPPIL